MTLDEIKVRQVTRRLEGGPRFTVRASEDFSLYTVWDLDLGRPNASFYADYTQAVLTANILNSLYP